MAPLQAPRWRTSLPDEITADAEANSNRDAERALSFHHTHSLLIDETNADHTETSSRSFHHDGELSSNALFDHVNAWCSTISMYRCIRGLLFVAMVAATAAALVSVVTRREKIFDDDSSDDYYFRHDFENYGDFLLWGNSGGDKIVADFNSSMIFRKRPPPTDHTGVNESQQPTVPQLLPVPTLDFNSTAVGSLSEEGLREICPYDEMMRFVTGLTDDKRCSYLNPGGYVQGCTAGFYQPGMHLESNPRPCPNGFMCPLNFACTVPCAPGSQCFNSTFEHASGKCVYPDTMEGAEAVDPLYPSTMDGVVAIAPIDDRNDGIETTTKGVCPGAAYMILCKGGYFCRTATSNTPCPSRYFCPLGSIAPTRCPLIAKCEGGETQYPNYGMGIIEMSALLVGTFVAILIGFQKICSHFRAKRRSARQTAKLAQQRGLLSVDENGILRSPLLSEDSEVDMFDSSLDEEPLSSLRDKRETMIELTFTRLGIKLRSNGVKVLNGISGSCRPGRVTAIMGPSGAGKTTLMNALCGRATHGQRFGTLLVNGVEDSVSSYSDLVGFVPQDDIMHDDLTVKETLLMYSGLRLPSTLSRAERIAVVADVMAVLEIREIAHAVIGSVETRGISGGQRKRVNIAMEMVADPSLLFLDEPTSGLDSNTSFSVLAALKKLSRKGANVIAVLHQPSYEIFQLLDDVIFLSNGGFSAFVGPAAEAEPFFTSAGFTCPPMINQCDFFLDVIAGSKKYPREGGPQFDLVNFWEMQEKRQRPESSEVALRPFSPKAQPAGFWRSLRLFMVRAATQQLRAYKQFLSDLLLESFAGILVGILFPHVVLADFNKWLCFMAMGLGLTVSIASLRVFGNERVVFWREAAFIDVSAYFISKNIVELPRIAGLTLFFVLASYPIVTPNLEWVYCWAFCSSATFAISGFAYFVSIALNPLKAQLCTVTYVLVAVMFSGLATTSVLSFKGNPFFMTLSYLSIMRWLSELIFLRQVYSLSLAWRMPPPCYMNESESSELHWLLMFGLTPISDIFSLDVAMLLLLGVVFRILAFTSLIVCNRNKRGLRTLGQIVGQSVCYPLEVLFSRAQRKKVEANQLFRKDSEQFSELSPLPAGLQTVA